MEGESLFNDATSIVLFEIFFRMVKRMQSGETASDLGIFEQMVEIASSICWLAFGEHTDSHQKYTNRHPLHAYLIQSHSHNGKFLEE